MKRGTVLFREGEPADGLYVVQRGSFALSIQSSDEIEIGSVGAGSYFGELGLLLARRTATARAREDAVLWRLPRDRFEALARERPDIGLTVATSVADRLEMRQREILGLPAPAVEARPLTIERRVSPRPGLRTAVGTALAIGIPLALWQLAPPAGLDERAWHVVLVLAGAAIAWLLEPFPDFVVAIALAAAWGLTGGAPLDAILSGFTSSSWVLALSALTLAAAMAHSGLLYRVGLFLLRAFPATHTGQVLALIVGGIVLTPLVPQSVARVAAIGPVTAELRVALGQPVRSGGAAALAFAGLVGHWYFANLFLTGFATNFFVLELVPEAERAAFGWWGWLGASAVALVVSAVAATAAVLLLFRPEPAARPSAEVLHRQLRVIAGLSNAERVAAAAVGLLVVGFLLQPVLGIDAAWIALASLAVSVAGVLGRDAFRTLVDWPYLVLLGILFGSGPVLQGAGLDRWLAAALAPVAAAAADPALVVLGLAGFVVALRSVLPSRPTMLLMALVAMPAAPALGISPWIAGVVVLMAANTWVLPVQGLEYLVLRDATRGESFTDAQGMRMGVALILVRFLAIAASIPYWMATGLIR